MFLRLSVIYIDKNVNLITPTKKHENSLCW